MLESETKTLCAAATVSPASRSPSAAEAAEPGVWLPLGKLRGLPLPADVLVALLEELRHSPWPEPISLASPARLAAEAANLLSEQLRGPWSTIRRPSAWRGWRSWSSR